MADELISRQAAMDSIIDLLEIEWGYEGIREDVQCIFNEIPPVDAVSRGLFEQIKWERDIAMEQLEEHGIAFGAKAECAVDAVPVVRCKDCIRCGFCGEATNLEVMGFYGYCSRGKRREENAAD